MNQTQTLLQIGLVGCAAALAGAAATAQTPTQASSPKQTTSPAPTGIQTGTGGVATSGPTALPSPGASVPSPGGKAAPLPPDALPSLTPAPATLGPAISGSGSAILGGTTLDLTASGQAGDVDKTGGASQMTPAEAMALGSTPGAPESGQTFTLQQVLAQAHANEPTFLAAAVAAKSAHYDTLIAKAALLPIAIYHNQYLFTKAGRQFDASGNQVPANIPIFVANNVVHEYVSQASITETVGAAQLLAVSRAASLEAVAKAELEISRRGLTSTVVSLFYNTNTTANKTAVQQRAVDEAKDFVTITQNREAAREVAKADVIKAQLVLDQRKRDLDDARQLAQRAKIDLGILLFPDPRTNFGVAVTPLAPPPARQDVEAKAQAKNPELASAMATLKSRGSEVSAARAALLPDVVLNFAYGIDNANFATRTTAGLPTLGYSASATVDVPVWDWFAGVNRIHQATLLRDNSKAVLSATQRTLLARLEEYNGEADLAFRQIKSLQDSAKVAGDNLRLAKLRYTAGEALVIEVTDAQSQLLAADLALADGITRYQLALANIELLTGTI